MMPTQIMESMMEYSFPKSKRILYSSVTNCLFAFGLCCGEAPHPFVYDNSNQVAVSFQRVDVQCATENKNGEMTLLVTLTNLVAKTFYVFPSEISVNYYLEYDEGEPWIEGWGSRTLRTKTVKMSDVSGSVFCLEPLTSQLLSLHHEAHSQPRMGYGRLTIFLHFYPIDNVVPPSFGQFLYGNFNLDFEVDVSRNETNSMDFIIIPHNTQ